MFDKITIRATMSEADCVHLASVHHLQTVVNSSGEVVGYKSGEIAKFGDLNVMIKMPSKGLPKLTIVTSLHKFWYKNRTGEGCNYGLFTISEAKQAIDVLLMDNGLDRRKARVTQFELGLNLPVSFAPDSFIELVKKVTAGKEMYVDVKYRVNLQKTTERHREIRKYFKMYDKGHEVLEKKRDKDAREAEPEKILRIETVYKRHDERVDSFFADENVRRLVNRFYLDWKDICFMRSVRACKGARKSEVERANLLCNIGEEAYLERIEDERAAGLLTPKQYRTIREFIRDYEGYERAGRFKTVLSPQEAEYRRVFNEVFKEARK